MPIVIASAEVEDVAKWEEGFKTHTDLFKKQGIASPIIFNTNPDNNTITIKFEVNDLDQYMAAMQSEETAEAMAYDGVIRETVGITVLDRCLEF